MNRSNPLLIELNNLVFEQSFYAKNWGRRCAPNQLTWLLCPPVPKDTSSFLHAATAKYGSFLLFLSHTVYQDSFMLLLFLLCNGCDWKHTPSTRLRCCVCSALFRPLPEHPVDGVPLTSRPWKPSAEGGHSVTSFVIQGVYWRNSTVKCGNHTVSTVKLMKTVGETRGVITRSPSNQIPVLDLKQSRL